MTGTCSRRALTTRLQVMSRTRPGHVHDRYLFAAGLDYASALRDFAALSGVRRPPSSPSFLSPALPLARPRQDQDPSPWHVPQVRSRSRRATRSASGSRGGGRGRTGRREGGSRPRGGGGAPLSEPSPTPPPGGGASPRVRGAGRACGRARHRHGLAPHLLPAHVRQREREVDGCVAQLAVLVGLLVRQEVLTEPLDSPRCSDPMLSPGSGLRVGTSRTRAPFSAGARRPACTMA